MPFPGLTWSKLGGVGTGEMRSRNGPHPALSRKRERVVTGNTSRVNSPTPALSRKRERVIKYSFVIGNHHCGVNSHRGYP